MYPEDICKQLRYLQKSCVTAQVSWIKSELERLAVVIENEDCAPMREHTKFEEHKQTFHKAEGRCN